MFVPACWLLVQVSQWLEHKVLQNKVERILVTENNIDNSHESYDPVSYEMKEKLTNPTASYPQNLEVHFLHLRS